MQKWAANLWHSNILPTFKHTNEGAKLTVSGNVLLGTNAGDIALYTNNTNVGIGTANPAALLSIMQTGEDDHFMRLSNATNDVMYVNKDGEFYFGAAEIKDISVKIADDAYFSNLGIERSAYLDILEIAIVRLGTQSKVR